MADERARPRPGRFRRRLTAAFVLVAAASSGMLAVLTLALSQGYRWRNFRAAAESEAGLALALAPPVLDEESFARLRRVYEANGGTEMLAQSGARAFSSSETLSVDDLPEETREQAGDGQAPSSLTGIRGHDYLVIAADRPGPARYYFLFSAEQVQASLGELRIIVAAGWLATTAAAAGVGTLVARSTLRPVREAADASTALAAGLLDTRLAIAGADEFGAWATAFNHMADALSDKINALAASAERERRFTSDVAHELRTPLTGMAATASMLSDELDELPPAARRLADLLIGEVGRLRDLVLELLELSRLDSGTEAAEIEELALRPAVESVVDVAAPDEPEAVTVAIGPEVVVVADRARLRRILTNLIGNSLVHGRGPVEVAARACAGGVAVEIGDRGPGIPDEDLPHVFERFFKSDRSRATGGSGLGLAIADEHARAMGAALAARNRPGGGAVFTLTLPAPADPAAVAGLPSVREDA